jgi:putative transcriptional regulator
MVSQTTMHSLKGQLLLDGGKLAGSEFHRTVVLVCEHNAEGAFGLVLNRPSPVKVSDALAKPPPGLDDLPLFIGGPVEARFLSVLLNDEDSNDSILPGLRMVHTLEDLRGTVASKVKFLAGYAGWSPGQLDGELKRAAWLTHPATVGVVFDPEPATLWKRIVRTKGTAYRLLAEAPDDISRN